MPRRTKEHQKLTETERLISPEEWEALNEVSDECVRRNISFSFSYDSRGFRLEIKDSFFRERGEQMIYRNLRDLVVDGWRIFQVIAAEEHMEDILESGG